MGDSNNLSSSLEDYLEAIAELSSSGGAAHCNDIARLLDVKKPSVTAALRSLADKGLVNYQSYMPISLTDEGRREAEKIIRRHHAIRVFFEEILGVSPDKADEAACKVEHAIGEDITERFVDFVRRMERDGSISKGGSHATRTLDKLEPGEGGRIVKISNSMPSRKKFADMGVVNGAEVRVERVAPMGDPMDVKIKGYHLSLRKREAAHVTVAVCDRRRR